MQLSTRESGSAIIVDVVGDIDLYNSPEIRKVLMDALRIRRVPAVVVNLTKVRYIDSSGVASLVEGLKVSRELQSKFILFGLSPAAREVLELSRLIKVFIVCESEEDAVKAAG